MVKDWPFGTKFGPCGTENAAPGPDYISPTIRNRFSSACRTVHAAAAGTLPLVSEEAKRNLLRIYGLCG